VAAAYSEIAEKLQIPDANKANVSILTLVSDWLSEEENGAWLMVLDNADDADVLDYSSRRTSGKLFTSGKTRVDAGDYQEFAAWENHYKSQKEAYRRTHLWFG
jgi:hypothetical protein